MVEKLKEKLWAYIVHNNPDLMFNLQEDYSVTRYLDEKINGILPMVDRLLAENTPQHAIEELALKELTADLKPSRFLYLRSVLEEEFPDDFKRLSEEGVLTYEILNLLETCQETFETFSFSSENEGCSHLRHAIIAQVHDHLL
jgi:hypothetical protein